MTTAFDARNWYWIVAGDATRAFSSAAGDYVPVANSTYQAWLATHAPTTIDTAANLGAVLAPYLLRPVASDVLDGYQTANASNVVTAVVFRILFNHENRLRAIERALSLNGSPPNISQGQALATVKALM